MKLMKYSEKSTNVSSTTEELLKIQAIATKNGMCEGCGMNQATIDFLCDDCHEAMVIAYDGNPVEEEDEDH